eukprot:2870915-Pyramimonas_sp.AAC.1
MQLDRASGQPRKLAHWQVDPGVPSRDAAALFDRALLPSSHIFRSGSDAEVGWWWAPNSISRRWSLEGEENDKGKKEQARRTRRRMSESSVMGNPPGVHE